MIVIAASISRSERFERVGSTNEVVRDWLSAGEPEICLAVAGEQTAGRGRDGRTWVAPPGAGLLLSVGFRPTWLAPDRVWRLAATVSLAMAGAAEEVAGLAGGAIGLKWPNDLVIDHRKLGGVLGETSGLGTADPTAIVGIGINVAWSRNTFPPELAGSMTSLADATKGGSADREALLERFTLRLQAGLDALRDGRFNAAAWEARQALTGETIEVQSPAGEVRTVRAIGVDMDSGALIIDDGGTERPLFVGDIRHVRSVKV